MTSKTVAPGTAPLRIRTAQVGSREHGAEEGRYRMTRSIQSSADLNLVVCRLAALRMPRWVIRSSSFI
jgi:hypothetical protein